MNAVGAMAQEQPGPAVSSSYVTALVGAWLALAFAALPLLGWSLDYPLLTRFLSGARPTWPLTSIGYIFLTLSLLATIMGRWRFALALVSIPATLGVIALSEHLLNAGSELDLLLFRDKILLSNASAAGRPGYHASITFLVLTAGIALANLRGAYSGRIMTVIASLTLGFGILSASLILQGVHEADSDWAPIIGSLPAALSAAALSISLLAWKAESGWRNLMDIEGAEWRILRIAFPIILTAPTLISTLQFWLIRSRSMPAVPAEFLGVGLNMVVLGGLLFWSSTMLVRGRAAFQEMSSALDSAAILLTGLDGRILHWSKGCEDLYGWTAEEAIGRRKHELVGPGTLRGDDPAPGDNKEQTEVRRDGRQLRVLQQARRLERWGKDPVLVMSMIDITERTKVEDALRESETRLAMALDAHGIGIFEWDVKSGAIQWSTGAEKRLGLDPGAIHDFESWEKLVHPEDAAKLRDTLAEAVRTKAARFGFEFRFNQPNGKVRTMEGSARAFYDDQGELVRTIGVNVDVTERDEREAQLQAREAQLLSVLETVPDAMVVINETGHILSFSRTAEQLFGYPASDVIGRDVTPVSSSTWT